MKKLIVSMLEVKKLSPFKVGCPRLCDREKEPRIKLVCLMPGTPVSPYKSLSHCNALYSGRTLELEMLNPFSSFNPCLP